MKIQYCSDLHLEFLENREFLKLNPLKPKGDILLLVGDISPFAVMDKQTEFINYVSDNFQFTYWIPGNHEYYYSDAASRSGVMNEKIRDNVFLVNNVVIHHDDLRFIFSTLWAKINPHNEWNLQQSLSDFQVVKSNGEQFTPYHFNLLHQDCFNFIQLEIKKPHSGKTVVATHYVPTFFNYPEKYKGDSLNEGFAVELFDFIEASNADCWIYGHHHYNTPDFAIGKTQLLTNQLGYVKYGEHQSFKHDKTFNLKQK